MKENKKVYRIQLFDGKILNAGTNKPSWFDIEEARQLVNRSIGQRIIEDDGLHILWEVF